MKPAATFLQAAIGAVLNLRYRLVHLAATVKFGFEQIYVRKKRVLKFINLKTVHSLGNLRLANDAERAINQAQAGLAKTCGTKIINQRKRVRNQKRTKTVEPIKIALRRENT